jgi:hypothetical protein
MRRVDCRVRSLQHEIKPAIAAEYPFFAVTQSHEPTETGSGRQPSPNSRGHHLQSSVSFFHRIAMNRAAPWRSFASPAVVRVELPKAAGE